MKTTMTINKDLPIAFRTKTMTKTNIDLKILESHLRIGQKPWARLGELSDKGRPPEPNRLFFLTLFKRPLTPPPLVFEHLCCGFF